MPLISIIIPVYNVEKYLHRCLRSICSQTYPNWEAILVNDGSTDCSGSICNEFATKDKRFKVIHQKNGGVVNARNKAIKNAIGEYLAFVDSDDYIEKEMLEDMISLSVKNKLHIVCCQVKEIYADGTYAQSSYFINEDDNEYNIRELLLTRLSGYLPNKLIQREFYNKCNITTDASATMWEDTYICLQLLSHNPKISIVDKALYNYNKTNENATTYINKASIVVKAEKNIFNIYNFLIENCMFDKFRDEFINLALKLKIGMLHYDIDKAITIFPFAHSKLKYFNFTFIISLFYWIGFNCRFLGKLLFSIHFKMQNK